jgi:hypothetical protein
LNTGFRRGDGSASREAAIRRPTLRARPRLVKPKASRPSDCNALLCRYQEVKLEDVPVLEPKAISEADWGQDFQVSPSDASLAIADEMIGSVVCAPPKYPPENAPVDNDGEQPRIVAGLIAPAFDGEQVCMVAQRAEVTGKGEIRLGAAVGRARKELHTGSSGPSIEDRLQETSGGSSARM